MSPVADRQLPEDLWTLPFINAGVSGIVFAVDEFSVIKTPTGGVNNARELEVERQILERLGEHPRVVRLLKIHRNMAILERLLYPLRARIEELRDDGAEPTVKEILKWSAQAAEGMQYLHSKQVYQVDIGLHNLLLDWDENIKYCDFSGSSLDGGAALVAVSPHAQHPCISHRSPSVQSELFSLASAIYEISTTHKTYEGKEETEIQNLFAKGEYPPTDHLLLGRIIVNCWSGRYQDAGEVATEIRQIQRRLLLGDPTLSLSAFIRNRKDQKVRKGESEIEYHFIISSFNIIIIASASPRLLLSAMSSYFWNLSSTMAIIARWTWQNLVAGGLGIREKSSKSSGEAVAE